MPNSHTPSDVGTAVRTVGGGGSPLVVQFFCSEANEGESEEGKKLRLPGLQMHFRANVNGLILVDVIFPLISPLKFP